MKISELRQIIREELRGMMREAPKKKEKTYNNEPKTHPQTGQKAPEHQHWVFNIMSRKWQLESDDTPYGTSVGDEHYWSS